MKTLLLIDANSLIHRCFHALPPLTTPDGRPSQALYGISNVLLKIVRDEKPHYIAALFDRPEPTFRKEQFKAYKAHRPKAPDELISQIIAAHELFDAFGIKTFEQPGFEADDLIATLARRFGGKEQVRVVILTGDLDTLQLVEDGKIIVRAFRQGVSDTFFYDEAAVKSRYGLPPRAMIDYKALVGDTSDNIPGVTGIGPKTAETLLVSHGTIQGVYAHLAEVQESVRKKLETAKDQVMQSKELVTLRTNVPVSLSSVRDLGFEYREENVIAYFTRMGFTTLLARLEKPNVPPVRAKKSKVQKPLQGKMF